jgi:predicted Zn-ribbon and HTH transcriptional regulator
VGESFKRNNEAIKIVEEAKKYLQSVGGVKKEDDLVNDLKTILKDDSINQYNLQFLFKISGAPFYFSENDKYYSFWYSDKQFLKKAQTFINKAIKYFANKKEDLIFNNKFSHHLNQLTAEAKINDSIALNYFSISKKFATNPFNDFGLAHWEEINPKTARAKAYLVLKKENKPLHFKQIADIINKAGFKDKKVYAQTIHNELIKDPRFVLVGRGMYGLKEQGYMPGTAKDIITKILKSKGPLSADQVIKLVSEQRFLKENTILLNLQNKRHFKKLPDGRFHIA